MFAAALLCKKVSQVRLTIGDAFMYSEERKIVRINPGLASLKEVQEMRKQRTVSLALARTLSARHEGSSLLIWQKQLVRRLANWQKEVCERTLSSACQLHALPMVPARTGIR